VDNEGIGDREYHSSGTGWGQVSGFCEHGNEPSVYIKCREFLVYYLFKKCFASWY
jgi:hypothetical protein